MKCAETYAWLLISHVGDDLPVPVRRHLRACVKCRRRRRRLSCLEWEAKRLGAGEEEAGEEEAAVRTRFVAALQRLPPRPPLASPALPGPQGRLSRLVSLAAALLSGLAIGWLVGSRAIPGADQPGREESLAVAAHREEELVTKFVHHNLGLAEAVEPTEQITLLAHMAADLRAEAFHLARQGLAEDLPLMSELYGRVVSRGLVGRWFTLPAAQRRELLPSLLKELETTQAEVDQTARTTVPPVADFLRPLSLSAETASRELRAGAEILPEPNPSRPARLAAGPGSAHALLAVLVTQGLLLAEEDDPLRRAYCCNAVADEFSQALLLASTRGDAARASQLGKHLESVIDRGVSGNLKRVTAEDAPHLSELRQVIQRANRAVDALETGLARRAPDGRSRLSLDASSYTQVKDLEKALKDLEKALRTASTERKDKGKGKGKHKGKDIKASVYAVDPASGTISLLLRDKEAEGDKLTTRLGTGARIHQGANEISLADLKPGTAVKISFGEGNLIVDMKVEGK
jgi:hypothetical protein